MAQAKVAVRDNEPLGFLYLAPIADSPVGPRSRGLAVIPCLFVRWKQQGQGAGSALLQEAEQTARGHKFTGIMTTAHYHDMWFSKVKGLRLGSILNIHFRPGNRRDGSLPGISGDTIHDMHHTIPLGKSFGLRPGFCLVSCCPAAGTTLPSTRYTQHSRLCLP